jgi:hypothetical protein
MEHSYISVYGKAEIIEEETEVLLHTKRIYSGGDDQSRQLAESPDFIDWIRSRGRIIIAIEPDEIVKQPVWTMS